MGFAAVVAAHVGSEVADSGLARRPTLVQAQIGEGVIHIHTAVHPGGVGKHIGWVPQLQLFAKPYRDLIAVHRHVPGGQINHRLQADCAVVAEQVVEPTQQDGPDVVDPGHTTASSEGFFAEMDIDHSTGPRPIRIKRRWCDLQRLMGSHRAHG